MHNGASVDIRDSKGKTPLYVATEIGSTRKLTLVIKCMLNRILVFNVILKRNLRELHNMLN